MDLYLPADYLSLREELEDWRDCDLESVLVVAPAQEFADPTWQTL